MSFLAAAIRHLLPTAPVTAPTPAPEPSTAQAAEPVQTKKPEPFTVMTIYQAFIRCSPLASAASPAIADALDVVYRDPSVQRNAGACEGKLQHLFETAGYRAQVDEAVRIVAERDGIDDIAPAAVAEVLRQRAEDIEHALEYAREDRAAHQAASLARMERHAPLRRAVTARLDALTSERSNLIKQDEGEALAAKVGIPCRFTQLRNLGLSEAQIEATEPSAVDPDIAKERRRARLVAIDPEIAKLRAFGSSATFDAAHLAGLEGFDELIAAREGEKAAA